MEGWIGFELGWRIRYYRRTKPKGYTVAPGTFAGVLRLSIVLMDGARGRAGQHNT